MGKDKLRKFRENETFECLVQPEFDEIFHKDHKLKGRWREEFFGNSNPVWLELGCGRGEYTIALARLFPETNFIGIDIKGARMWRGAKTAVEEQLPNAGFLRTRIEFIESFFGPGEIEGLWITFPDPQLKKTRVKKRLTSPDFLAMYSRFLKPGGSVNLKTDSRHLHDYTMAVAAVNGLPVEVHSTDIYGEGTADGILSVKTAYEAKFLKEGLPITYMRFGLGGKGIFLAPDFEPDNHIESIKSQKRP